MTKSTKLPIVFKELKQLKKIEHRLEKQWDSLSDSGKKVRASFLSGLADLEARAADLEKMLDA